MKKNISTEELGKMASRVLAAVLAVPIPSHHPEFDKFIETDRTPQEKMARLAVLLSLQQPPTRQSLIKDAARFGIVQVFCLIFLNRPTLATFSFIVVFITVQYMKLVASRIQTRIIGVEG